MALVKNESNARLFVKTFRAMGYPDNFIAALGGNWVTETAHSFEPNQVQLSYLKQFGTCDEYVRLVDNGFQDFANDKVGFGYSQLTSSGRKKGYLDYCKAKKCSIADSIAQFEWADKEIHSTGYANVRKSIKENWSIEDCTRIICSEFERPASMQKDAATKEAAFQTRIGYAKQFYNEFVATKDNGEKMSFELYKCILTNNDCYKDAWTMNPEGIIVHSTGANNPNLRRYVQPDDGILGVNPNNNSWNRGGTNTCVHAFIGKDKNGKIKCYQTLPFNYSCWGIGRGTKGSYNYPPTTKYPNDRPYIQFEICEDGLTDPSYFYAVMDLAQEFCAYLISRYPAIKVENVISHHEGYIRGMGSGHADCDHWLSKFGKNMNWFRSCVQEKLKETTTTPEPTPSPSPAPAPEIPTLNLKEGDVIKLVDGATYYNGKTIPSWVFKSTLYYRGTNKNGVIISTLKTGAITGTVSPDKIIGYKVQTTTTPANNTLAVDTTKVDYAKSYDKTLAGIYSCTTDLNIRTGAGVTKSKIVCLPKNHKVTMNGYYTTSLGVKWFLVAFEYNNKKYTGFCSSLFLKK